MEYSGLLTVAAPSWVKRLKLEKFYAEAVRAVPPLGAS